MDCSSPWNDVTYVTLRRRNWYCSYCVSVPTRDRLNYQPMYSTDYLGTDKLTLPYSSDRGFVPVLIHGRQTQPVCSRVATDTLCSFRFTTNKSDSAYESPSRAPHITIHLHCTTYTHSWFGKKRFPLRQSLSDCGTRPIIGPRKILKNKISMYSHCKVKKGKVRPRTGHEGPKGE